MLGEEPLEAVSVPVASVERRPRLLDVELGRPLARDPVELEVGLDRGREALEPIAELELGRGGEAGVALAVEAVGGPGVLGPGAEDEVAVEEVVGAPRRPQRADPERGREEEKEPERAQRIRTSLRRGTWSTVAETSARPSIAPSSIRRARRTRSVRAASFTRWGRSWTTSSRGSRRARPTGPCTSTSPTICRPYRSTTSRSTRC